MAPSGVKKSLKALLARKLGQLPDLGQMADASELLTRGGYGSVSRDGVVWMAWLSRPFLKGLGAVERERGRGQVSSLRPQTPGVGWGQGIRSRG